MSTTAVTSTGLEDFSGELLAPGDPAYDEVRRVWNGAIDRRPAFIARCRTTGDVASAVVFARRHDLPIAVRGGGHSLPGHSVCEGGLMIDLQPMKGVAVDPGRRTADVEPGVLWQELDAAAHAHGLATPGGEISDTGVAGLTLGGGIGWLSRMHGLAADNLLAVEIVTADGEVVEADDETDPELMWGLRGGGGNFGIVTRFRFRLHEVGAVWAGMVVLPGDLATDVLGLGLELAASAPRELSTVTALVSAPPAPFVPPEAVGTPVVVFAAAMFGDPAAGPDLLEPVRRLAPPMLDTFGVTTYPELQRMFDDANVAGRQNYVKSDFLRLLDAGAVEALARHGGAPSSPLNQVLLRPMGGRVSEVEPSATAFANRDVDHLLTLAATWEDPAADPEPHRSWVRALWADMRPWAHGTYVNHLGDEGSAAAARGVPGGDLAALTGLKGRMDPDNVFALNQNIPAAHRRRRPTPLGSGYRHLRRARHERS